MLIKVTMYSFWALSCLLRVEDNTNPSRRITFEKLISLGAQVSKGNQ